ncbi:MAG: phosphoribosylaminoimidazolecarboxamide formyltransferase/IMP cyclohydrolase, partial [Myxococcota bacterium]
ALTAGDATLSAFNATGAAKAFAMTARYDLAIGGWLRACPKETRSTRQRIHRAEWPAGDLEGARPTGISGEPLNAAPPRRDDQVFFGKALGDRISVALEKEGDLRYGENPHQKAAFYSVVGESPNFTQLGGEKALSYNNLVDMDAARAAVSDFSRPTVAIIKHTNPCGLASADSLVDAYAAALASDPVSAFGSIVAVNRPVGKALVDAIGKLYVEVIVAPAFTDEALAIVAKRKKNCRVIQADTLPSTAPQLRQLNGGWLVQDADTRQAQPDTWRVVTKRAPSQAEQDSLRFAMRVAKHVKSNAIIFVQGEATVGVGAGQMSRVDAVHLAVRRAGSKSDGAVLASDAFFPFPDGIEAAAAAGVRAVIQPGGSMRDDVVIEAADRLGLAMVMTGMRHFKH